MHQRPLDQHHHLNAHPAQPDSIQIVNAQRLLLHGHHLHQHGHLNALLEPLEYIQTVNDQHRHQHGQLQHQDVQLVRFITFIIEWLRKITNYNFLAIQSETWKKSLQSESKLNQPVKRETLK